MRTDYSRDLRQAKWGSEVSLHGSNPEPFMSALGQKQTLIRLLYMSALPPKADIGTQSRNVRFVPKADILRCGKNVAIRSLRRRRLAGAAARRDQAHLLFLS
jgi:hypothetical protein